MKKRLSNLQWSVLVNSFVFTGFLLISTPNLDSVDDFFYLYTLAGGNGNEPTHLLHYIYTLHPLLTWPLPYLFQFWPKLNWYTFFLLLLHLVSCIHLLQTFLTLYRKGLAIALYCLFFLFVEAHLLLSFNYSNTSLIVSLSGLFTFLAAYIHQPGGSGIKSKHYLISLALVLVGGLLRVHMLALCVLLITWAALFFLSLQRFKVFCLHLLLMAAILLIFIEGHRFYYQKTIHAWNQEERLRQSLFFAANRPMKPTAAAQKDSLSSIKASLIQSLFLYDTSFITLKDIDQRNKNLVRVRGKEDLLLMKWTFINNKGYFVLAAAIGLLLIGTRNYRFFVTWLMIATLSLGLFIYFFLFLKITEAIFLAFFSSLFLPAVLFFRNVPLNKKTFSLAGVALVLISTLWALLILERKNSWNIMAVAKNRQALRELASHPGDLFINTGGGFSYGNFYIWDIPSEYPANNLIYSALVHTNNYQETFQRFGIKDIIKAVPTQGNIYFIGHTLPLLKEYYAYRLKWETEACKIHRFKHLDVYQLRLIRDRRQCSGCD